MKSLDLRIIPEDILAGGILLWKIQTKERLFNGRIRIAFLLFISIIFVPYYPLVSFLILWVLGIIIFIDFVNNFWAYRVLANQQKKNQKDYVISFTNDGFQHLDIHQTKVIGTTKWNYYDYLIDIRNKNILILIDKKGGANLYFESWMSKEDFELFRSTAMSEIGRKLDDKFI